MFISCLEEDLLSTKKGILQGDVDMMLKRLKVFLFYQPIEEPEVIVPCAHCFAHLLYGPGEPTTPKRKPDESGHRQKGESPPTKKAAGWSIDEVVSWLGEQGLARLEETIRKNGVDGALLCELTRQDLREELGCTGIEAAKILSRLP